MRVLLLEDREDCFPFVQKLFEGTGLHLARPLTLREAKVALQTQSFDFVIADMDFVGLDGVPFQIDAFFAEILLQAGEPGLLLVGSMASCTPGVDALALAHSVNLFAKLDKPVAYYTFAAAIRSVVSMEEGFDGGTRPRLREDVFMEGMVTDGLLPIFQPKFNAGDKRLVGLETFARWQAPHGGLLGAGAIIRMARRGGYMDILTHRMLELVIAYQSSWAAGAAPAGCLVPAAVNVGGENLQQLDFAETVLGLCEANKLAPNLLQLDIMESEAYLYRGAVLETLQILSRAGVRLALDDFGTGYAALLELAEIPFQELIIDRRFVRRAVKNPRAQTILGAAIELAHKLDLLCTCEGVESEEELALIRALGADRVQGHYLARPASAELYGEWVRDYVPENSSVTY